MQMAQPPDFLPTLLDELPQLSYDEATGRLMQIIESHPGDARVWLLLGGQHAQKGKMDLAEACFSSAIQHNPELAIARFQLGLLQFTSGRPSVAAFTWAALDQRRDNDPLRLFKRAFNLLAEDQLADAVALFRAGMQENKENAALNQDMQKMIIAIEQTMSSLASKSAVDAQIGAEATEANAEPEASTQHFLMSVYRSLH